ncbi:MAG: MlaD family protein [Acetobacteraceae bacterium]
MPSGALLAGSRPMYLRVGILVLVGLAAIVALVLFLSNASFSQGVEVETYFDESVQGLSVGAPVKYLGVTLGHVADIGLVAAQYGQHVPLDIRRATYRRVYVRFTVNPGKLGHKITNSGIADAVNAGLRARIASQGITGLSYLTLDFVSPTLYPATHVPWKPLYPPIPSMPSTISQVQTAAEKVANELGKIDFKDLAQSLIAITHSLQTELASGGNANQTLVSAQQLLKSLQATLQKADLPGLTTSLRATADAVGKLAANKQLQQTLANTDRASAEMAEVAKSLPPLIAALSRTAGRTDTATAEVERRLVPMLADLQATASNLRETTNELRSYPAGALFGRPPPRRGDGR